MSCRPVLPACVLAACITLLTGCPARPREVLVPVAGKVTVDGQPLPLGWVTFYPDPSKGNTSPRQPYAEIQQDGTYQLMTLLSKPGAAPGCYKVVVAATRDPWPARPAADWSPNWLHAAKYADLQTTDLRVEVVESPAPGRYDLRLER